MTDIQPVVRRTEGMSGPVTEAGRELLARLGWFASEKGDALREGVAAIESEARQAERERMAQAVERGEWDDLFTSVVALPLAAARQAALSEVAEGVRGLTAQATGTTARVKSRYPSSVNGGWATEFRPDGDATIRRSAVLDLIESLKGKS